jgi:hypothetical protein
MLLIGLCTLTSRRRSPPLVALDLKALLKCCSGKTLEKHMNGEPVGKFQERDFDLS